MNFWPFIKELKGDMNYSDLSEKLQLAQPYDLTNSSEQNIIPTDHIVRKIAAALHYDPEELIDRAHSEKEPDTAKKHEKPAPSYPALRNQLLNCCSTMNLVEEIFSYHPFGKMEEEITFVFFYYTIYVGEKLFRADRAAKYLALHHPALDIEKERKEIGFFASAPPKPHYFQEWIECLEKYYSKNFVFPEFPEFPNPTAFKNIDLYQNAVEQFNHVLSEHAMLHSLYLSCVFGMESIKIWYYFPQTKSIKIIDNMNHDYIYFLPSLNVALPNQEPHSAGAAKNSSRPNQLTIPIVTELTSPDDIKKCFEKKSSRDSFTISPGIFATKVTSSAFRPAILPGQTILYSFLQKPTNGDYAFVLLENGSFYLCLYRITHEGILLQPLAEKAKDVRINASQIAQAYKIVGIWYK
ncbi:hypothetical protein KDK77_06510 [bacterium]|nr:hypothetical protein [bacterium]MCP5461675.1 hypothetical protein [bacterium]